MKPLACHMLFKANNHHQFERRIDRVARKFTLQIDKHEQTKNCFQSKKQQLFGNTLFPSLFETKKQKFFFKINVVSLKKVHLHRNQRIHCDKLSNQSFGNYLRKYCILEQLDDNLSLNFEFEFLLTKEFTFITIQRLMKDNTKPPLQKILKQESKKRRLM